MTSVPTPAEGLRTRVELELERSRSQDGSEFTRFALTYLHPSLIKRQVRHGIWNAPRISLENPRYYVVQQQDVGRLFNLASDYYDDPRLWWAIAHVNDIKNPLEDMEIGMTLVIPRKEAIIEALEDGNRSDFQ